MVRKDQGVIEGYTNSWSYRQLDTISNPQSAFAPSEGYESVPFNVWEQRPE